MEPEGTEVHVGKNRTETGGMYPVPGVPGFMLTLTGERFRVCVRVRAQVQLGNVLFLPAGSSCGHKPTNLHSHTSTQFLCLLP